MDEKVTLYGGCARLLVLWLGIFVLLGGVVGFFLLVAGTAPFSVSLLLQSATGAAIGGGLVLVALVTRARK